ncbi:hypothetical protein [Maridesulfovibrio salexigens]|uniref:Uncharacterized protein n=1 Tax=Maridesulfovibrio salexigens (strain ATCC 14822 / DSM 2638 / NCIMB 8403 / VKM B-1763) TaxID=526222 RepID=C6BVW5_MARSD|nr:hypothetical protein [Maridesulfovibrio salexigens]ACS80168.1 hypothetical protein Desal_2108 [Maridesulfovibrio salexigens DSM 2638]
MSNLEEAVESAGGATATKAKAEQISEILFTVFDIEDDNGDYFICNSRDAENKNNIGSLWYMSDKGISEAKKFNKQDNIDYIKNENFIYTNIKSKNYDFKNAEDNSYLEINIGKTEDIAAQITAAGKNCDRLFKIYNKHIKNNI